MKDDIFKYLKKQNITDIEVINKLFFTAFVKNKEVHSSFARVFVIDKDDPLFQCYEEFYGKLCQYECSFEIEDLIRLFEFVISPSDRIVNGAVYTPKYIRSYIIDQAFSVITDKNIYKCKIADISCGCGSFLVDCAYLIHNKIGKSYYDIYRENIYGLDIEEYATTRTKILLSLLAINSGEDCDFLFNIERGNALSYEYQTKYDIIVGNPPYVCSRNMSQATKALMNRWSVCSTGHPDLYIPFFQIAIENLSNKGFLGYITMNSFLKSVNGRALRDYLKTKTNNITIIDFRGEQVFKAKNTYTCVFLLRKTHSKYIKYAETESNCIGNKKKFETIKYDFLDSKYGWNLNNFNYIRHFEQIGEPIKKCYKTRHGVATLCNNVFIFNPTDEDDFFYYFEKNSNFYKIEKGICRNVVNSNKLNSDVCFEDIIEKIIYPYTILNGKACVIEEHCLQNKYPFAYEYLNCYRMDLSQRDKGNTSTYPAWYAYGRTQSLVMPKYKLFLPKIANKSLRCVLNSNENLLLYNGMSFVGDNYEDMLLLKKILESDLFWQYLIVNSKPYSSNYYALNGNNIDGFGIPNFSDDDKQYLLYEKDREKIELFLSKFYEFNSIDN